MTEPADFEDLLETADQLEEGPTRVALLEQAVRLADTLDDVEKGFQARHQLVAAALMSGQPDVMTVAFSWCLAQSDQDPERFPENLVLWRYRWVINELPDFPHIRKAQIEDMLADMSRRYLRADSTLRPFHMLRRSVAARMGDLAEAARAHEAMQKAPRDSLSDAPTVEADFLVWHLILMDQNEMAVATGERLLSGGFGKYSNNGVLYSDLLLPLLKLGQAERALDYHQRGYRRICRNSPLRHMGNLADHLTFLALTDNLTRGLKLLEKHLPTALIIVSQSERFEFLLACQLLLSRFLEQGQQELRLRLPASLSLGIEKGRCLTAELSGWLLTQLHDLAGRFDARNGNSYFHDQISDLEKLKKWITPCPLPVRGRQAPGGGRVMSADPRFEQLLAEADAMDDGPVKVQLLEEAVRLADTQGDVERGFAARQDLVSAAHMAGFPEQMLVAYSWCLAQSDHEPQRFDRVRLLWGYRWVINYLPRFPQISKSQIETALEDMTRRYREADISLRPVHLLTRLVAKRMGNRLGAARAHRLWQKAAPDWFSDAPAMEQDFLVSYLVWLGRDEQALAAAEPLLAGRFGKGFLPEQVYAELLLPLLRLGQVETALAYQRKSIRLIARKPPLRNVSNLSDHVTLLALTGNLKAAVALFEKTLPHALATVTMTDRFDFYLAGRALLDGLQEQDKTELKLRLPATFPLHDASGRYPVEALSTWLTGQLTDLAECFDARNGNDYFKRRIADLKKLRNLAASCTKAGGQATQERTDS